MEIAWIWSRHRARRAPILVLLAALGAPSSGSSQVTRLGDELEVNTYTTQSQGDAAVAVDAGGGVVVVWASEGSLGDDTDSTSIQGRIYDSEGQPLGGQFQVNTYTTGGQGSPSVAAGQGGFVVVWGSGGSSGTDSDSFSIQGQRFASNGMALGEQFQVNSFTTGGQFGPAIAMASSGDFVVVWTSEGSSGSDSDSHSVQVRLFDPLGVPVAADLQANSYTSGKQWFPAVASDPDGRFVVTWHSDGSFGSDASYESIQARPFDASGQASGDEFQVNDYSTAWQRYPSVSVAPTGQFVVAWQSMGSYGDDVIGYSVQAQRFDPSGARLGGQFQVNTLTMDYQAAPAVASDADGGFVLAWYSDVSAGNDDSGPSVQARRYAADGMPLGVEFQVNSDTSDVQWMPAVATGAGGSFVVVWEDGYFVFDPPPPRTIYDVRAQFFLGAFFYDGFESGDASRWSASVP